MEYMTSLRPEGSIKLPNLLDHSIQINLNIKKYGLISGLWGVREIEGRQTSPSHPLNRVEDPKSRVLRPSHHHVMTT